MSAPPMNLPPVHLPGDLEARARARQAVTATVAAMTTMIAVLVGALIGANSVECHGMATGAALVEAGPVIVAYPLECRPVLEEAGL